MSVHLRNLNKLMSLIDGMQMVSGIFVVVKLWTWKQFKKLELNIC